MKNYLSFSQAVLLYRSCPAVSISHCDITRVYCWFELLAVCLVTEFVVQIETVLIPVVVIIQHSFGMLCAGLAHPAEATRPRAALGPRPGVTKRLEAFRWAPKPLAWNPPWAAKVYGKCVAKPPHIRSAHF